MNVDGVEKCFGIGLVVTRLAKLNPALYSCLLHASLGGELSSEFRKRFFEGVIVAQICSVEDCRGCKHAEGIFSTFSCCLLSG